MVLVVFVRGCVKLPLKRPVEGTIVTLSSFKTGAVTVTVFFGVSVAACTTDGSRSPAPSWSSLLFEPAATATTVCPASGAA